MTGVRDAGQHERYMTAYLDGLTLSQVGERFGVTRQRAQQVLSEDRALYALGKRRNAGRRRRHESTRTRKRSLTRCRTCGADFLGGLAERSCGATCAKVWLLLRHALEDSVTSDQHARHRVAIARHALKASRDPVRVRYAMRVLEGSAETRGRWLVEGGLAYHWALRAVALGWPIAELLCQDVQEQLRARHGGSSGTADQQHDEHDDQQGPQSDVHVGSPFLGDRMPGGGDSPHERLPALLGAVGDVDAEPVLDTGVIGGLLHVGVHRQNVKDHLVVS